MSSSDGGQSYIDTHHDGDSNCVPSPVGVQTQVAVIMARAYAAVLIVLAIGFVGFILMISFMAFEYPDRAKQFLDNFAGPAAALILAYIAKSGHEYIVQIGKKN